MNKCKYLFKELRCIPKNKPLPEDVNQHVVDSLKEKYPLIEEILNEYRVNRWYTGKAGEKASILIPDTYLPKITLEIHHGVVRQFCVYKYKRDKDGSVIAILPFNIKNETVSFKNGDNYKITHNRGDTNE